MMASRLIVVVNQPILHVGSIYYFHVNSEKCISPFTLDVEIKSIFYDGNRHNIIDLDKEFKI
jgi:hypothetical protein